MFIRNASRLAMSAVFATCAGVAAQAATVTKVVTFTANTFNDRFLNTGVAPVDPVEGSFTITLDDAVTVTDQTAGIVLGSLNITLGSPLAFNYDHLIDRLEVGGLATGANAVTFSPAQDDFWFFVDGFLSATPAFVQVGYAQSSAGNNIYFTLNQTGTVDVRDPVSPPAPVPLPAAFPLLLAGLAGLTGLRWRARRTLA